MRALVIILVTGCQAGVSPGIISADFQSDQPQFGVDSFLTEDSHPHPLGVLMRSEAEPHPSDSQTTQEKDNGDERRQHLLLKMMMLKEVKSLKHEIKAVAQKSEKALNEFKADVKEAFSRVEANIANLTIDARDHRQDLDSNDFGRNLERVETFRRISSGTCEEKGFMFISSDSECRVAAKALRLDWRKIPHVDAATQIPDGCIHEESSRVAPDSRTVAYNFAPSSIVECGHGVRIGEIQTHYKFDCLCRVGPPWPRRRRSVASFERIATRHCRALGLKVLNPKECEAAGEALDIQPAGFQMRRVSIETLPFGCIHQDGNSGSLAYNRAPTTVRCGPESTQCIQQDHQDTLSPDSVSTKISGCYDCLCETEANLLEENWTTQTIIRKHRKRGEVSLAVNDRGEVTVASTQEENPTRH